MTSFPKALRDLPDKDKGGTDLFARVWEIVKECGEEERHFNQLQSVYRGVASTWLLATFAAVGYMLFDKDGKLSHPGIAAMVCYAGAFGIILIWTLDLHVYHRLLVAVFREGLALEQEFPWLPRFRTNMANVGKKPGSTGPERVRRRLAWYYVGTEVVPVGAGTVFWGMFLENTKHGPGWRILPLLALLFASIVIGILFVKTTQEN